MYTSISEDIPKCIHTIDTCTDTLPKFNMAAEKVPAQKEMYKPLLKQKMKSAMNYQAQAIIRHQSMSYVKIHFLHIRKFTSPFFFWKMLTFERLFPRFYLSSTVSSSSGAHRIVKLGSCWGGWGNQGQNPSYHAPGVYRMCRNYMTLGAKNGNTKITTEATLKMIYQESTVYYIYIIITCICIHMTYTSNKLILSETIYM